MCLWKEVVWPLFEGHKRTSYGLLAISFRRGDENCSPNVHGFFFEKKIRFETKLIFTFHQASTNSFFTFGEGRKVAWRSFWNRFLRDQRKILLESMFSSGKINIFSGVVSILWATSIKLWRKFLGRFVTWQSGCPAEFFEENDFWSTFSFLFFSDLEEQTLFPANCSWQYCEIPIPLA